MSTPANTSFLPSKPEEAIEHISDQIGLKLDSLKLSQLVQYLQLLHRWNSTYNLTAVRDPSEMIIQHLADCLVAVSALCNKFNPESSLKILDVGSGGGLPGVVLAIVCPTWEITCVDSVGKKAAFLRQVAAELQLPNLHAEHSRVETLNAPASFNIITSRAFAALADFVNMTRALLAPTGTWVAMKGKLPDSEISIVPTDVEVFHVEQLMVPYLHADRCLIWMRPRVH